MSLSWGPCLPFPKASCDALRRAFLTMWSVKGGLFIHGSPLFFINGLVFAGALLTYVEGAGGGFIELIEARPRPHSRRGKHPVLGVGRGRRGDSSHHLRPCPQSTAARRWCAVTAALTRIVTPRKRSSILSLCPETAHSQGLQAARSPARGTTKMLPSL